MTLVHNFLSFIIFANVQESVLFWIDMSTCYHKKTMVNMKLWIFTLNRNVYIYYMYVHVCFVFISYFILFYSILFNYILFYSILFYLIFFSYYIILYYIISNTIILCFIENMLRERNELTMSEPLIYSIGIIMQFYLKITALKLSHRHLSMLWF